MRLQSLHFDQPCVNASLVLHCRFNPDKIFCCFLFLSVQSNHNRGMISRLIFKNASLEKTRSVVQWIVHCNRALSGLQFKPVLLYLVE